MLSRLFSIVTLAAVVVAQQSNVTIPQVEQAFSTAGLVPSVIPTFSPTGLLGVIFFDNTTSTNVTVTPGQNMTREQNALRPTVLLTSNDTSLASQTFVLAMVDPDAPTPQGPTAAQIRHLLAPGMTLSGSLAEGALLVNNTPAISDFLRPTPPAGSDPHRYILLLFVQPANFSQLAPSFVNASTPINNFNITLFSTEAGLGNPVAGNFFLTGPDNTSVPASTNSSPGVSATNTSPSGTSAGASSTTSNAALAVKMMNTEKFGVVGITMTFALSLMGLLVI